MILADTDVLIDYLAGAQPVTAQIAGYIKADQLETSAVTCFELLSGATSGKRAKTLRVLIDALTILPLDRHAAERAAEVRQNLDRSGQAIGMGDSLIAGIARANHVPLFTRNRRHFERVPDLKLVTVQESVAGQ